MKISSEKLHEKFIILEKDYKVFTKSSLKAKPKKPFTNDVEKLVLDNNSPTNHHTSSLDLQQPTTRRSSSSFCFASPLIVTGSNNKCEVWNVRTNELAKEEIRQDRKLEFEKGKLKGRRLLFEEESEEGCSFLAKCSCNAWDDMEDKQVVVKEGEKYVEEKKSSGVISGFGGKSMVLRMIVALGFMLFVVIYVGFIGYDRGIEVIPLPT